MRRKRAMASSGRHLQAAAPRLLAAVVLALFGGCGSGLDATVDGTVTLDGQPLTNGTVSFHPKGTAPVAYGQIQSDGTYTASTGSSEGITPGEYTATVVATKPDPDPSDEKPPEPLTPVRYASPETSGLDVTVRSGQNHLPLELRSK